MKVEFHGMDGLGGTLYIGTGCFHRRETLLGREFSKENKIELKTENITTRNQNAAELKLLASSDYEKKTKWGIEVHFIYLPLFFPIHLSHLCKHMLGLIFTDGSEIRLSCRRRDNRPINPKQRMEISVFQFGKDRFHRRRFNYIVSNTCAA